jgi:diguanylate cyclase (GGDEF)-like protein
MNDRPEVSRVEADERALASVVRGLLWTFIALTGAIALIGTVDGSYRHALVALTGASVYALLLLGLRRLGARRAGLLCTAWYLVLAAGAMATGRGIHDITVTLLPAGILLGAVLLERRYLARLVLATVCLASAVGILQVLRPGAWGPLDRARPADVAVLALLLLVSGVLTGLVVRSLQDRIAERERAEEAAEEARRELETRLEAVRLLNDLAASLQRGLDIPAIAAEAVRVLVQHSRPPRIAVYLLANDGRSLRIAANHGFTPEEWEIGKLLPVEGSLSGLALREKKVVTSEDLAHDERAFRAIRVALAARGIASGIAIPLVFGQEALGTMNLLFPEHQKPSPIDLETYQAVAQAVSLAVTNAQHLDGLEFQAFHDPLTRLPNRASLHRDFQSVAVRGGLPGRIGLVLLDINRFREINDALGHSAGDRILVQIGSRFLGETGGVGAEVYRLGGDEFAVLLPDIERREAAEGEARRVLELLARPFDVSGLSLEVRASAGVAMFPDDATDSHQLLRCADVALYRAKQSAGSVASYSPEHDRNTPERLALISELSKAIRDGDLVVHFQPQVALASREITGFEALVRWPHPLRGLLPPAAFVPLAEENEMMNGLTYFVVENALTRLASWQAHRPNLTMGVNLSVRNLLDRNCARRLAEIIRRVGVDPALVEFELTETAVMSDPEMALSMLGRITATGARLAIDDFGTGFFSLAYLKQFPVHGIKIDRSFVSELCQSEKSRAIVRSSVELAKGLGLRVVAEGIEDSPTVDVLHDMGCGFGQGFFFSVPAPADIIETLLGRSMHLPAPPSEFFPRPS